MTDAHVRLPGVILLGGEGRRFGGPKSSGRLPDGSDLLGRAIRALAPACDTVLAGGTTSTMRGLRPLPDPVPGRGPLGGLVAALGHAREVGAPGVVVLAVDLPRMNASGVLALVHRFRAAGDSARTVVVASGDSGPQPLAGVWGVEALSVLAGELESGRLRVLDALDAVGRSGIQIDAMPPGELEVVTGHRSPMLNVNRPEDAAAAVSDPICPPIVGVVGWKNSGKTTLAAALVAALSARGLDVCAMKRGHDFDLDREGSDSHRLAEAGAGRLVLAAPDRISVLGASTPDLGTGATALAAAAHQAADVVVAEGWKGDTIPVIEVRRGMARDHAPIVVGPGCDRRMALVSDRDDDLSLGALPVDEATTVEELTELVLTRVVGQGPRSA